MPQISIIIPIFNAQKTLKTCLESIFKQTFKDYEIIAVNDGSTDKSFSILEEYSNQIKIINQKNSGANVARNSGAKISQGEYLIFCDADIILNEVMLEKMLQTLEDHPEASYVYSSFIFGQKIFKLWPFDPARLKKMPYIHTTSLIKKNHFPGFDENIKRFQDWDLWLTMLEKKHIGYFIDKVLFKVKSGGTMSAWVPKFFYKLPFLKTTKKYKAAEKIIKLKHSL